MTEKRRAPVLLIVAVLAAMLPAGAALAQGARGVVPDPITSQDLDRMAERLELSSAQREFLDTLHQGYLAEYRALRSGEIETLLQATTDLNPWRMMGMDTEAMRDAVRALGQVLDRVKTLDTALFDGLTPNLSESQAERLLGAVQQRERARLRTGAAQLLVRTNQAAGVDLGELYRDLLLSPAEREATEPMVAAYEQTLTAAVRRVHQTSNRMADDMIDKIAETQAAGTESRDRGFRMFQTLMQDFDALSGGARKQVDEIAALNARTLRDLGALLTVDSTETLRGRYLDFAYADAPRARLATMVYREVLRFDDLPDTARDEVAGAAVGFRERRDRLANEAIEAIDESRQDLGRFFGDGRREHRRKMDAFAERMRTLEDNEIAALRGLLMPAFADRVDVMLARRAPRDDRDATRDAGARGARGGRAGNGGGPRERDPDAPERFVPSAMTRGAVGQYAARLGLPEDMIVVAEVLHDDYLEAWRDVHDGDLKAVREGRQQIERSMRGDGEPLDPAAVKALYERRERVIDTLLALDRGFFADLETLVTRDDQKSAIRSLALSRQRAVYGEDMTRDDAGGRFGWMAGSSDASREPAVDVRALVDALALDDDARAQAEAALADHDAQAAAALRRRYALARTQELAAAVAFAESAASGEQRDRGSRWRRLAEVRQGQRAALSAATDPIVALNRAAVESLAGTLGDDHAHALRTAYDRAAYPQAYDAEGAAERYLASALELPDLDASQRSNVTGIIYEYRPAYEQACHALVAVYREPAAVETGGWQSWRERRSRIAVLEFDRDQVNARARRQLRNVLDEDQRARIGLDDEDRASERE